MRSARSAVRELSRARPRRGLSLFEMMIAVLVLGILAATAARKAVEIPEDANITTTVNSLMTLREAIELHYLAYGEYPGTETQTISGQVDFINDVTPYLNGPIPKSLVPGSYKNGVVAVARAGIAINPSGYADWAYDCFTGQIIINTPGFAHL